MINGIPLTLLLLDLDRHWSWSSLSYSYIMLEVYARSLDLLKIYVVMMRRPRCSIMDLTNLKLRCSYDMEVVMLWIYLNNLIVKRKFMSHVLRSCNRFRIKIMWLVPCESHMVDKSHDHDITIAFLFRHKLCWVCSCPLRRNLKWEPNKKLPNQMLKIEGKNLKTNKNILAP